MSMNRRSFLKKAAVVSAGPFIVPSSVWAADVNPSDRIVMGFIGMGKQNGGLLNNFINQKNVEVVAVCDVDTTRREAAQKRVNDHYAAHPEKGNANCSAYNDFREIIARDDIDAVCIATPDHWHAFPTIAALNSGKDVYCEKPLTHNVHEAVEVMKAVKRNKGVLQTGSMQRSSREFRIACELVRNGVIGDISRVDCSFGPPGRPCDLPTQDLEPGLDWEMWVGAGPMRGYNTVLSPRGLHDHYPNWRVYKEYGGGMVCDWGAHHLDIMQWGLGMDKSGPNEVHAPSDPAATKGAVLHYGKNIKVHHQDGYGIHFHGKDGEVLVNRGRFEFHLGGKKIAGFTKREDGTSLAAELIRTEKEYLDGARVKLYESRGHQRDFLTSVKERTRPITNEEVGGRSAICCHLVNQAYYNNTSIKWKPKKMKFAKNGGDPKWLTRDYRAGWTV